MSNTKRFWSISTQISEDEMSLYIYSKINLNQLEYVDQYIYLNKEKNIMIISGDICYNESFSNLFSQKIFDLNNSNQCNNLISLIDKIKNNDEFSLNNNLRITNEYIEINLSDDFEFRFYYPEDYGKELMVQYFKYVESYLEKINNNS